MSLNQNIMSDDDLFKKLNTLLASEINVQQTKKFTEEEDKCRHENILNDLKSVICKDCGIQLSKDFSFEKEWRYYGSVDSKYSQDPNRCSFRKIDQKGGLMNDLVKYNFPKQIVNDANDIYELVTKSKIFRGKKRKGIIFACVYHAFNKNNSPLSCQTLIHIFEIETNVALRGLKFVNINIPIDSPLKNSNQTNDIQNLIHEIMCQFHATPDQITETLKLYDFLINKSSLLNRSRPGSVAAAIVKYYIMKRNPHFTSDFFKNKIRLSELTLSRITREIELILS